MGRVAPDPENVLKQYQNVPKFGGLKKGETARINVIEFGEAKPGEPFGSWREFVHNLTVQAIEEDRPDGSKFEIRERKWLGSYICPGREEILAEHGFDAEACPICARAPEDEAFKPMSRHATNIVIYGAHPDFRLLQPFRVEVKPWLFNEKVFRALTALHSTWKDLRRHDLLITCENGKYQNYDIQPSPDAAWLDPQYNPAEGVEAHTGNSLTQLVVETFKNNKLDDEGLSNALGTKAGKNTLAQKAAEFATELGLALQMQGATTGAAPAAPMGAEALADMLNSGGGTPPPPPAAQEAPPAAAPVPAPVPAAAAPPPETATETPPAPAAAPPAEAPGEAPVTTQKIEDLLS